ncbi:MAG: hypothetical protein AUG51_19650 [Acidobacteria bacterium 13_1_20CM_3_53_8]|nr:MAG: hypothetical protein AUG51_19650 [Acidobacteria bacterium 13_1_20CM_3_53_8]
MSQPTCACTSFERLEGASVNAYIASFLKRKAGAEEKNLFKCRICGREWERLEAESQSEGKRASLVRVKEETQDNRL